MPSVQNFADWAVRQSDLYNAATVQDCAGNELADGGIADIRTSTNCWQRFFETRGYVNKRNAAIDSFRIALGQQYGQRIADLALRKTLNLDRGLTALTIMRSVSFAKKITSWKMLGPNGNGYSLRLDQGSLDISEEVLRGYSADTRRTLKDFIKVSNEALQLLGALPVDQEQFLVFSRKVTECTARLSDLMERGLLENRGDDDAKLGNDVADRLSSRCRSLIDSLGIRKQMAQDFIRTRNPTNAAAIKNWRSLWREALFDYKAILTEALADDVDDPSVKALLRRVSCLPWLMNKQTAFGLDAELKYYVGDKLEGLAAQRLKERGIDAVKLLNRCYYDVLNRRAWNPIEKQFSAVVNNREVSFTSNITPRKAYCEQANITLSPETSYEEGVNGYMCHCADTRHAVNLAHSELKMPPVDDPNGAPQTVFSGIRHGVHCAWKVRNNAQRADYNHNRAIEAVQAAFIDFLDRNNGIGNNNPIHLPMTSVSLLTPDLIRLGDSNECKMLREQTEAWRSVDNRPLTITVNGRDYTVIPQVATFNFGVNEGSLTPVLNHAIGSWHNSMNSTALQQLNARVDEFLADNDLNPQLAGNKDAVRTLRRQLNKIIEEGSHHFDDHEAYKAASRAAVLTYLMGGVPCWNCKSGKDRTGQMDVECKFLATIIASGQRIPEPGSELTTEQKALYRNIALQGGNHEMQEYNTGVAGFKTGNIASIKERLGGDDAAFTFHAGGSNFVKV